MRRRRRLSTLTRQAFCLVQAVALVPAAVGAQAAPPPVVDRSAASPYKVAVTGGISWGYSGWGTEPAGIGEVSGRFQVRPAVGVGASYFNLGAGNNESGSPFSLTAFELNASWHPIVGRWFDPSLRAGGLVVVNSGGGYMNYDTTSRWGLEGMAAFDFVHLPLAAGLQFRSGFTNRSWNMAGLHVELRI